MYLPINFCYCLQNKNQCPFNKDINFVVQSSFKVTSCSCITRFDASKNTAITCSSVCFTGLIDTQLKCPFFLSKQPTHLEYRFLNDFVSNSCTNKNESILTSVHLTLISPFIGNINDQWWYDNVTSFPLITIQLLLVDFFD